VADDSRRTHLVAPGDTWSSIAETYFGTPAPAERLALENGGQVGEPPTPGEQVTVTIPASDLPGVRRLADAREPYNHGVQLLEQERPREAAEAFEEALRRAPDFVDARYNLGLALLRMDRSRDAVAPLRSVVAARPADQDAHYALASAYFHQQQYPQALTALDAALALDPRFLRARFTRAMTLERLGDAPRARAAWQEYLELDAGSAWAQEARQHLEDLD
jgi:tetratricopeptide (TPR) repeat protein